jgi:hypothetical protein
LPDGFKGVPTAGEGIRVDRLSCGSQGALQKFIYDSIVSFFSGGLSLDIHGREIHTK